MVIVWPENLVAERVQDGEIASTLHEMAEGPARIAEGPPTVPVRVTNGIGRTRGGLCGSR
jgi:hypothetical protein